MWGNRAFLRLWAAGSVSYADTLLTTVVLPILVYQSTGSAWETSLLAAIEVTPYIAFGLIAGAISDQANRRQMMYICEAISAVLVGSVPIASAFGVLSVMQIYVVAAGTATTFVRRDAAGFGAIPSLVGRDVVATAYAWMSSTSVVLQIAEPGAVTSQAAMEWLCDWSIALATAPAGSPLAATAKVQLEQVTKTYLYLMGTDPTDGGRANLATNARDAQSGDDGLIQSFISANCRS
jgi:MFS family permease